MNKALTQDELILIVERILKEETKNITVALDGRCASGKTTLGKTLAEHFGANLFHIDDYFLRPEQRTAERLDTPGGNFDIERFMSEIINGISSGKDFYYRPFDCKILALGEEIKVQQNRLNIIEGSYSCHPAISKNYDLTVFVTTETNTQKERILKRNGEKAPMFFSKWIPLEEKYFSHFDIENKCDFILRT